MPPIKEKVKKHLVTTVVLVVGKVKLTVNPLKMLRISKTMWKAYFQRNKSLKILMINARR